MCWRGIICRFHHQTLATTSRCLVPVELSPCQNSQLLLLDPSMNIPSIDPFDKSFRGMISIPCTSIFVVFMNAVSRIIMMMIVEFIPYVIARHASVASLPKSIKSVVKSARGRCILFFGLFFEKHSSSNSSTDLFRPVEPRGYKDRYQQTRLCNLTGGIRR